jgi:hypothetical protein
MSNENDKRMSLEITRQAQQKALGAGIDVQYVTAVAALAHARATQSELAGAGASTARLLESREQLERAKSAVSTGRASITSALWSSGRLANAPDLGQAVEAHLQDIVADARATVGQ